MSDTRKDLIVELLEKRESRVKNRCDHLVRLLKAAPQGALRVVTRRNKNKPPLFQYYLITERNDTQGKYIRRELESVAAAIAQRDYEEVLLADQ